MERFVIPENFKTYEVPLENIMKKLPPPPMTGAQRAPVLTWFSGFFEGIQSDLTFPKFRSWQSFFAKLD